MTLQETEIKKIGTIDSSKLCVIVVDRNENGLEIHVTAPAIEEWFSKLLDHHAKENGLNPNKCVDRSPNWPGLESYQVPLQNFGQYAEILNSWGGDLRVGQRPNISFLRARGLGKGIVLKSNGLYSREFLEKWIADTKKVIADFYRDYKKEYQVQITILTAEPA